MSKIIGFEEEWRRLADREPLYDEWGLPEPVPWVVPGEEELVLEFVREKLEREGLL